MTRDCSFFLGKSLKFVQYYLPGIYNRALMSFTFSLLYKMRFEDQSTLKILSL